MTTLEKKAITVETTVNAPVEKVWALWTEPRHITNWNFASADWHSPRAENDLREGGRFSSRMESRDGSMGFDFGGTYTKVEPNREIRYNLDDNRQVTVLFTPHGNATKLTETFDPESSNSEELQQQGWQAILNNFKQYAEASGTLDTMHFQIRINAPAQKVYDTMLAEDTYRQWTAAFSPTSRFEGSWNKGEKILFLGTDKDGKVGGMVSRIRENEPARFVSIEHLGMVSDGQEITSGPAVESWAGAQENYTFQPEGEGTLLMIDLDVNPEFYGYFHDTWPKALQVVKELCEA